MSSSYRIPKTFKPATLDTEAVEPEVLTSKKHQLWQFTFPQDFNVSAFSELELHLPAESSSNQSAQHVASFELDGQSYRIIEGSVFESSDIVNLFPSTEEPGHFVLGKPFSRSFRICREVVFPAPPKPIPVNPRGRAPEQLANIQKNFFPLGYINESLTEELTKSDRQGRILRSTSARPESPRLLPQHGFSLKEWRPAAFASSSSKSSSSKSDEARKKEKKAAKRAAESGEANPSATKKPKLDTDEESAKKKSKKSKKEKE